MSRLLTQRKAAGLSQTKLAALAGISQNAVHKFENDAEPRVGNAIRLARALNMTVEDLFGDRVKPLDERQQRIADLTKELAALRAKGGAL